MGDLYVELAIAGEVLDLMGSWVSRFQGATNPSIPAKNVKEMIAFAKAHPGQLTYGSAGVGSSGHLAGVLFNLAASYRYKHDYRGSIAAA